MHLLFHFFFPIFLLYEKQAQIPLLKFYLVFTAHWVALSYGRREKGGAPYVLVLKNSP